MSRAHHTAETLEKKTDAARARLIEVLDAIDTKRHTMKSPGAALATVPFTKRLALPLGTALGGFAALVASRLLHKRSAIAKVLNSVGISLMSYGLAETVKQGVKLGVKANA